jgi:hypothetical protein
MSRRDFASRFGAGSAAAVGLAWASPHISTIRFARKAQVGSPSPSTSTTSTTIVSPTQGSMSISPDVPCVGDILHIRAEGFTPRTAVTLELDSTENILGLTTAGVKGRVNVTVRLPSNLAGSHVVIVTGVQPGGRTLKLSIPVTIKTEAECHVGPQGSTTTSTTQPGATTTTKPGKQPTTSTPSTSVPTSTTIGAEEEHGGGGGGKPHGASSGSGFLAFTGTDSVDLALLGAAAAVGGRALFGLVAHRDEDEEDEE